MIATDPSELNKLGRGVRNVLDTDLDDLRSNFAEYTQSRRDSVEAQKREEVKEQLRDVFINAGGQSFRYIPCLNDNQDHIQALSDLVQHHLSGWPTKAHQ